MLLLLLTTSWDLSPQNLEGKSEAEGDSAGNQTTGVPGTSPPDTQDVGCTLRGSLLPVDLHIVLGAGAHWYIGVHQIEEFEAHLHIPVVGHLDREMLWGFWLLWYLKWEGSGTGGSRALNESHTPYDFLLTYTHTQM